MIVYFYDNLLMQWHIHHASNLTYKYLLETHIKTKIITHEYKQLFGKISTKWKWIDIWSPVGTKTLEIW
jgi:HEPN domain-containing protein